VREARHLARSVDAGVRAARDRELDPLPDDLLDGRFELGLDCALARLGGPAGKPGPVVGDFEPRGTQTSSRKTISVESERRGPSFTIRV
jgi:hypothetical protein